jgi:cobalt-zinc-cadmium efflux system outer membrane protein
MLRMPFRFCAGAMILFSFCGASTARGGTRLSYQDASVLALQGHPDLVLLRSQEEAYKLRSAQALAPSNPVLQINRNDVPGPEPFSAGASKVYGMSLVLGFPGKALAVSSQQSNLAESVREQALAKEIEILSGLSNIYVALWANQRLTGFLEEEARKTDGILKIAEKKYVMAQLGQVDLLNLRRAVANLNYDLSVARDDGQIQVGQFLNVIRQPGSREYAPQVPEEIVIPPLKLELSELGDLMMRNRPALRSAGYQVSASNRALISASLAPLPDFQLSGAMNLYNLPSASPIQDVTRTYSFGIGVSLPIFFPINELSGIRAARRDREASEAQRDSAFLSAMTDLQTAFLRFHASNRQRESLKDLVLPAAKAAYDLTLKSYSLGRADYLKLNDARATWVQTERDYLDKVVASAQLFNQLTQQLGCDFTTQEGAHACR